MTAILVFIVCTGLGVFFAMPGLAAGYPIGKTLLGSLAQWWAWGLVTPLIAWVDYRLGLPDRTIGWRLLAHVPLSFVVTVLCLYVQGGVRAALGIGSWGVLVSTGLLVLALRGVFLWSWLVYWLITGGLLARQYYWRHVASELRANRLELLAAEDRKNAVGLRVDQRFLSGLLASISSRLEEDPKRARLMLDHLTAWLRSTQDAEERRQIPLVEELAFLDHYLAILRILHGDRLHFEWSAGDEARSALVPSMTLQPLVENAVRHGFSQSASGGTIRVMAEKVAEQIKIVVEDDGAGLPEDWQYEQPDGLGLSRIRQRISGLYEDGQAALEIRRREGGGVEVELRIPFKLESRDSDKAQHG